MTRAAPVAALRAAFAIAAMTILPATLSAAGALSGTADVHDGDTFDIAAETIRLQGIDAPELTQRCATPGGGSWPCGAAARDRLATLAHGRRADCVLLERDDYGRWIARCSVDGVDLGAAMVDDGLAWAFRRYSLAYVPNEDAARSQRLGVWRTPTQTPWDYRAERWAAAGAAAPDPACPIKGNISQNTGERIYHTPWSPWYDRTRISTAAGERWFCDEAEAIAAGWRAARR